MLCLLNWIRFLDPPFFKRGVNTFLLLLILLQSDKIAADLQAATITGDEAVLAAERYTGKGKVLGASFVAGEAGRTTYRVKILMPSGVLRTVVVDAETGGVVE